LAASAICALLVKQYLVFHTDAAQLQQPDPSNMIGIHQAQGTPAQAVMVEVRHTQPPEFFIFPHFPI
jgi:hypothetical protein